MKKLFLILAVFCLVAVVPMICATQTQQTQPVSVTIAEVTELSIAPASLDFGSVRPLVPAKGQDIIFDSTGSNVDVMVSSSVQAGSVFEYIDILMSDNSIRPIEEFSISLPILSPSATVGTQILLPTGLVPGLREGIITYTITSTFCGDDEKNGYETCDGTDLVDMTCDDLISGTTGILTCKTDCTGFDTSLCIAPEPVCTPNCLEKTCGDDGCGGSCGTCATDESCESGSCILTVCTPESDVAFCNRLGKVCGEVTANDNCGTSRTINTCGECPLGQTCSVDGVCIV